MTRRLLMLLAIGLLAACTPPLETATIVPFNPPTVVASPAPQATATPVPELPSPTPQCTNGLRFIEDVTIPDGTQVEPGDTLDKRWLVKNDGSCNWDVAYGLTLITGADMGTQSPLPLYPAIAGEEAVIRILFTAPQEPGIYRSAWQAVGPDGAPFGDSIFIEVEVP